MELIANLFNPDQLLKEISGWSMNEIDTQFYKEHLSRLETTDRNNLKNLLIGQNINSVSKLRPHMKYELVHFYPSSRLCFHQVVQIYTYSRF